MLRVRPALSRLPALVALALFITGAGACTIARAAGREGRANCGMDPGPAESAAASAAKQCAAHTSTASHDSGAPVAPARRGPTSPCCDAAAPAAATDAPRILPAGFASLQAIFTFSFRLPRPVCGGFTRLAPNRAYPPPESPPAVLLGRAPPVV